jgi:hypothetical protein
VRAVQTRSNEPGPYGSAVASASDELDVRGRPLAALFDQLRDDVDADDLAHERRESDRERAGAGTDIERALLAGQRQQVAQPLLRRCRAAVLLLRDELSRLAEALPKGVRQAPAPPPWSASFPRRAPPRSVPAYDRVGCQIRVRRAQCADLQAEPNLRTPSA